MPSQDYALTREEAAQRLNVSIRTLDRYIRRKCFLVQRVDRHVWVSQPSFERYYQEQVEKGMVKPVEAGEINNIEISEADRSEAGALAETAKTGSGGRERMPLSRHEYEYAEEMAPVTIYKDLYEALYVQYEKQRTRLEGAHYRVGQLEARLKNMVPLLEVKRERKRLELMDQQYKATLQEAKVRVISTKRLIENERFNKNVYIALVYGLLALHPVFWLLTRI